MSESSSKYLPGLDLLRTIAILAVILRHAWEILETDFIGVTLKKIFIHGWIGVDLFFVLSGFLIVSQLLTSVRENQSINFKKFYFKRSLRILPVYFVVLAVYFAWPYFRETEPLKPAWQYIFFVMNFGEKAKAFSHAWSLCVEEHFYLFVPILVGTLSFRRLLHPSIVIAGIILGGMVLRYYIIANDGSFYPEISRTTYCRLDGLTVGATLALIKVFRPGLWEKLLSKPWFFGLIGLTTIAIGLWTSKLGLISYAVFTYPLIAVGFGALVVSVQSPSNFFSYFQIPGIKLTAALAYTLYLTHKQMFSITQKIMGNIQAAPFQTVALSTFLIVGSALILHFGIEKPGLKLRDSILNRKKSTASGFKRTGLSQ